MGQFNDQELLGWPLFLIEQTKRRFFLGFSCWLPLNSLRKDHPQNIEVEREKKEEEEEIRKEIHQGLVTVL